MFNIKTNYMWQISGEEHRFCFFIRDKAVKRQVESKKAFRFELWDMNFGWVYIGCFFSLQIAQQELGKISGLTVKKDSVDDIYYTEAEYIGVPFYSDESEESFLERVKWIRLQY